MTKTAAITSHYDTPVKSFAARLGGESVAGMIHHCSVSQTTDRPSPARCSSESQINWPDTSNDAAWKSRYGSDTHTHAKKNTLQMSVTNNHTAAGDVDDQYGS